MRQVDSEQRAATVARLVQLREAGSLSPQHIRLAAVGHGVDERTVRRWLARADQTRPARPEWYRLSPVDREAYAHFRGNVTAIARARDAALAGQREAAGVPVPEFLVTGWAQARPVALRTLQRAFAEQMTPAERAYWTSGEAGRRAANVYLTPPAMPRNQVWELDHKELPILLLPRRGRAVKPWLTSVVDDGTRALLGWAITLTPNTATVLTALRMALTHDSTRGPFGAVPAGARVDRGLEFAAHAVIDALAALCVDPNRLPGYSPHRKGKIERLHLTIEQTLLCGLPGYTKGPRDAAGRLHGPLSDRTRDRDAAEHAEVGPMRLERFVAERFAPWVTWYNTERPHSMLDGMTPLQAWNQDDTVLHRVDTALLLSREPMLRSRVFRRLPFTPLPAGQVPALMRGYHPIYTEADERLLAQIDDAFAHGSLRNWAVFTHTVARLGRDTGRAQLDEELVEAASALLGGGMR